MIHHINDTRVVDDGPYNDRISEDSAKARLTLHWLCPPSWRPQIFSKPWLRRTRGGEEGAAEEVKTLSSNNLPGAGSRRCDAFSIVSALKTVSNQRNIGPVEARPPLAEEDEWRHDRRSRGKNPRVPGSTQTITVPSSHEGGPITTHSSNVKASENGKERIATATTSSPRAHRAGGLRKPFSFVPAPVPIGSGTAPLSAS
ncbi:hypothetical protein BDN71DRAFT_1508320 [Pleurotus eryngii]|uniref:Uncharacterized protein n=1 Tax=Pleurotus eryngii TaxID=5323 RepID=A0A9P5ZUE3_PLEER|nr:hypothetical protein BDN71DRAFT_1508320 [Pleurotus eryngii]